MRSLLLSLLIFVSACSTVLPSSDAPFHGDAIELPPANSTAVTALDNRDVELADIVFDTFGRAPLTLATATADERQALLNAIPPLDSPEYGDAASGGWLGAQDLVVGYITPNGQPIAYPHKILNFHEIVNDQFDGVPVLISYCPLCGSGVVYDRRPDDLRHDTALTFSNTSALYDNDLVMVDRETGTYWWQVAGKGLVGDLTEATLAVLPSSTTTWALWKEAHPETWVLDRNTGFGRTYAQDPFANYSQLVDAGSFPFPVTAAAAGDQRLPSSTSVLVIQAGERQFAVRLAESTGTGQIRLGDTGATVVVNEQGIVDAQDGNGNALPTRTAMWFSVVAAFPEVELAS